MKIFKPILSLTLLLYTNLFSVMKFESFESEFRGTKESLTLSYDSKFNGSQTKQLFKMICENKSLDNIQQALGFFTSTARRADLNAFLIKSGNTPLHAAILGNRLDIVKYLCQQGANVNAVNSENLTPMESAKLAHANNPNFSIEIISYLDSYGADLNPIIPMIFTMPTI